MKFISDFRNRPYVRVTVELGTRPGIHVIGISWKQVEKSSVLNTDEYNGPLVKTTF